MNNYVFHMFFVGFVLGLGSSGFVGREWVGLFVIGVCCLLTVLVGVFFYWVFFVVFYLVLIWVFGIFFVYCSCFRLVWVVPFFG